MRPSERPSNNKLKLTSFASLDGLSLQLNLVFDGPRTRTVVMLEPIWR